MKIKIRSLIPGRIRINIDGLLHNENAVHFLKESLQFYHGIILISTSYNTGNILVKYDKNLIDSSEVLNIITSLNIEDIPLFIHEKDHIKLNKKKDFFYNYPITIYNNEIELSRRLLTLSVIISSLVLCFSLNLSIILSLIILGFPGILFFLRRTAYSIMQTKLKAYEIELKNLNLINELAEAKHMLIEDSILNYLDQNRSERDFIELPSENTLKLIRDFRNLGLLDIRMLSLKNEDYNHYLRFMLGINLIELNIHSPHDKKFLKEFEIEDNTMAIIKSHDLRVLYKKQILVFQDDKHISLGQNELIVPFNLNKVNIIPSVIEKSRYCNKLVIRVENISAAANTLGIFLALIELITPASSIALYFLNYLINTFYLKVKLYQHEKEYLNEIESPKYNLT